MAIPYPTIAIAPRCRRPGRAGFPLTRGNTRHIRSNGGATRISQTSITLAAQPAFVPSLRASRSVPRRGR